MEWFSGEIPVAIDTCQQQQSLFIVYIYDDSPGSNTTGEAWDTTEVQEVLGANKFVALKIAKDSTAYNQFSQLFPVFLYPSVFCIGLKGQSLVIMNGPQTKLQLREKLAQAFQKLQNELAPLEPPPPPVATPTGLNSPVIATDSDTTGESSCPAEDESSGATASVSMESKEEKLKRYQEKIKQRRQERTEEAIQREKQGELKRRQQSRDTAHFKKLQEERRNQNWVEERRAREAIRAKLEQDRRERIAERERLSQQRAAEASAPEVRQRGVSDTPVVSSVFSSVSSSTGMCRIQLRLPAGGTSVVEMNKMDTLADLRERVAQELGGCSSSQVSLARVYPREDLGMELDPQTLLQLQLAPSGVVIVRVKRSVVSMPGGGGGVASLVWGVVMLLVQLVVSFLSFLKSTVGGVFSSGSTPSQYQQKSPPSSSAGGHVRKFRQEDFQDDKEDDRNTYNGNSTQQQ